MLLAIISEDIRINRNAGLLTKLTLGLYRIGHALEGVSPRVRVIIRAPFSICYRITSAITGSSLPFCTPVGRRLCLPHGFNGIFISRQSKIGDDVTILQQVTIGSNYGSATAIVAPVIGDRVLIGAGAKIIGRARIGSDSRIGANAVVVGNVEVGSTFVAPQARLLEEKAKDGIS